MKIAVGDVMYVWVYSALSAKEEGKIYVREVSVMIVVGDVMNVLEKSALVVKQEGKIYVAEVSVMIAAGDVIYAMIQIKFYSCNYFQLLPYLSYDLELLSNRILLSPFYS